MRQIQLNVAAVLICVFGLPAHVLVAKKIDIASCPFQANVPGAIYVITQPLAGIGKGDCIDVTAPRITVNMNGNGILSIGGDRAGISIAKGASGVHIVGGGASIGGRIGFSFGIYDAGDSALIENVSVYGFGGVGLALHDVQGSVVNGVSVTDQGTAGILLQDTNHCVVENSTANRNGGQELGSAIGIAVKSSHSSRRSSNVIIQNQADSNFLWGIAVFSTGNMIVNNTANSNNSGGLGKHGWGIYLGASASDNFVSNNTASHNDSYDGDDEDPFCGTNHWSSNSFTKVNRKCIH